MSERIRGIYARDALMAIVKQCAVRGVPLPSYRVLAEMLLGISSGQVSRHMNQLMDEGMFTIRYVGRRIHADLGPHYQPPPFAVGGEYSRNGMWKEHLKETE